MKAIRSMLSQIRTAAAAEKGPMDKLLFLLTLILLGVGIVTVYDASYALAIEHKHGDSFYFVKLQAAWAVLGLIVMVISRYVPYWKWKQFAVPGIMIATLLVLAVLIPHIGISVGGARRWVGHGPFRIQPSELAKIALVLYLARIGSVGPRAMRNFKHGLLPPLLVIGLLALLIAKEPDLGTAMVLAGTGFVMLFLGGARTSHMSAVGAFSVLCLAVLAFSRSYSHHRLTSFLNPEADQYRSGYQVWHSLVAIGTGGIYGVGLGAGIEKLFIPMARTDFILPVIAEEWGLIGTLTLVLVYLLIAARGLAIAHGNKDAFGALLAAGITVIIGIQSIINVAVATSSIPDTGVPLPFISYGGSSLVLMMWGIGMLLNISCHPDGPVSENEEAEVKPYEKDYNQRWQKARYLRYENS
jgi:cell division protein FtsW